jgi:hypothetical protein
MFENRPERAARRPSRVDVNKADELRYWAYKLDCSPDQLKAAVRVVGSSLTAVTGYFAEIRNSAPVRDVA